MQHVREIQQKKIPTEKALCVPFGFVVHQTDVKKFLWKIQSDFAGASSSWVCACAWEVVWANIVGTEFLAYRLVKCNV